MIDPQTIAAAMTELGEPPYRSRQVYEALTRGLVIDFDSISNLPVTVRRALAERLRPLSIADVETRVAPRGSARKTLFATADGHPVEAVLMTYAKRATVCVSTQVGCAVGCAFCASGRLGLRRDLTAEEMVDQVFHFARLLRDAERRVTNVVFMGMGEPFHNYDETLRACRLLNDESGFGLAARAISVSTVGVVPGIDRFAEEDLQLNLAVSLHAGTDALRDRLVPLNRTYPLDEVFAACARYVRRTHRKVMFEYVVLRGVNDTLEQAQMLAARVRPPHYHLNLIAYNETGGEFARPKADQLATLHARLEAAGVSCTVRRSPGAEIEAACGQLALRRDEMASQS
ncbi:MAG TPA: 23S rRNA (adenine(2503)-C(2))-methyltransferase RlmN [Thermoleophilia bacterium]|jgi:23S rRNA (adenine2503-C2)-methyltransferase